jgi:UDP-glucose 4-epimerase
MKAIITGANGFIGSRLVKKLASNHISVISIIKDKFENVSEITDYSTIIYSDLTDVDGLVHKLSTFVDKDTIFYHLAWIGVNGAERPNYEAQIKNIEMACHCVSVAQELHCKKILISGSITEYVVDSFDTLPYIPKGLLYGTAKKSTHLFVELLCKNYGLPYIWMKISNIYGFNNKTGNVISYTISQLMANKEACFGPATQPYDFIYIDDVIEAMYRLGVTEGLKKNEYTISSYNSKNKDTIWKLGDYLKTIGITLGKPELIKIGILPDDGIHFDKGMFDNLSTVSEIGDFISCDFKQGIGNIVDLQKIN